jgi:hypothetical protein
MVSSHNTAKFFKYLSFVILVTASIKSLRTTAHITLVYVGPLVDLRVTCTVRHDSDSWIALSVPLSPGIVSHHPLLFQQSSPAWPLEMNIISMAPLTTSILEACGFEGSD